ncbi:hypothetical protein FH972_014534 [Carpinus fangiana]|uniref:Uncharacterized protein n=1 Tax=Carpinus fangiana TaxID=176857 RepID=A0A5N6RDA3_9ROSI|nr:hypothetical protein FH972_014534 [Carpinus fangiana]
MSSESKAWVVAASIGVASGGTERPRILQMESHNRIITPTCLESAQVCFSGQEAPFFYIFCNGF